MKAATIKTVKTNKANQITALDTAISASKKGQSSATITGAGSNITTAQAAVQSAAKNTGTASTATSSASSSTKKTSSVAPLSLPTLTSTSRKTFELPSRTATTSTKTDEEEEQLSRRVSTADTKLKVAETRLEQIKKRYGATEDENGNLAFSTQIGINEYQRALSDWQTAAEEYSSAAQEYETYHSTEGQLSRINSQLSDLQSQYDSMASSWSSKVQSSFDPLNPDSVLVAQNQYSGEMADVKAQMQALQNQKWYLQAETDLSKLDDNVVKLLDTYNGEDVEIDTADAARASRELGSLGLDSSGYYQYQKTLAGQSGKREALSQLESLGYTEEQVKTLAEQRSALLDRERATSEMEKAQETAKEHPVLSSALSVAMAPAKAVGNIESIRSVLPETLGGYHDSDRPTNIYSGLYGANNYSSTVRSQVAEDLEKNHPFSIGGTNLASFLYNAGMSAADSALNMTLSSGISGLAGTGFDLTTTAGRAAAAKSTARTMNWVMGSEVAADSMIEGITKGYSNEKALVMGIVQGAIEAATETWSVERIINAVTSPNASALRVLANSFASEGGEEVAGDWLNTIADVIANGNRSELLSDYQNRVANGQSKISALSSTIMDQLGGNLQSFLAGGLAGVMMGGASMVGYGVQNSAESRQTAAAARGDTESVQALVEQGLAAGQGTKAYATAKQIQQKLQNNQTVRQSELAKLVGQSETAIQQKEYQSYLQSLTARGMAADSSAEVHQLAEQIQQRLKSGKDVSSGLLERYNDALEKAEQQGIIEPIQSVQSPSLPALEERSAVPQQRGVLATAEGLSLPSLEETVRDSMTARQRIQQKQAQNQVQQNQVQAEQNQVQGVSPAAAVQNQEQNQGVGDNGAIQQQRITQSADVGGIQSNNVQPAVEQSTIVNPSTAVNQSATVNQSAVNQSAGGSDVSQQSAGGTGTGVESTAAATGQGAVSGESGGTVRAGAGERTENVAGKTRRDVTLTGERQYVAARRRQDAVNAQNIGRTSALEVGLSGGSASQDMAIVPQRVVNNDIELLTIQALNSRAGYNTHFFIGLASLEDGGSVEGWTDTATNDIWIQADRAGGENTAKKISDHERAHQTFQSQPGLRQSVAQKLLDTYGEDRIRSVLKEYLKAYDGLYQAEADQEGALGFSLRELMILEEVMADAVADRNRFQTEASAFGETVQSAIENYQSEMPSEENAASTSRTTGPPAAQSGQEAAQSGQEAAQEGILGRSDVRTGRSGRTWVNGTQAVNFTYAIVPLDSLIISNDDAGRVNPDYPSELQPRSRERKASQEQIFKMAKTLNPEMLGYNANAQNGAPLIRSDGVVIGGNGRSAAIEYAYRYGLADRYRQFLQTLNDGEINYGVDTSSLPENPVLVRVIQDENTDWAALSRDLNASTTSNYSASEQGASDAQKMTPDLVSLLQQTEEGGINNSANRAFIQKFLQQVIPESERAAAITETGMLSQSGLARAENAVFAYAYGDTALLNRARESLDNDAKNITNALLDTAAAASKIELGERSGDLFRMHIVDGIKDGIQFYLDAKADDFTVAERLAQVELDREADTFAETFAQFVETNKRSGKRIRTFLNALYDAVLTQGDATIVGGFFGEYTRQDALRSAVADYNRAMEEAGINSSIQMPEGEWKEPSHYGSEDTAQEQKKATGTDDTSPFSKNDTSRQPVSAAVDTITQSEDVVNPELSDVVQSQLTGEDTTRFSVSEEEPSLPTVEEDSLTEEERQKKNAEQRARNLARMTGQGAGIELTASDMDVNIPMVGDTTGPELRMLAAPLTVAERESYRKEESERRQAAAEKAGVNPSGTSDMPRPKGMSDADYEYVNQRWHQAQEENRQRHEAPEDFERAVQERAAAAKEARLRNVSREDFQGTKNLEELGIRIENSVGIYADAEQLKQREKAAQSVRRQLKRAEKRLHPSASEKNFASGIVAGLYQESDIPPRLDAYKVMELADYYMAERSFGLDMISQVKRDIRDGLDEKMTEMFRDIDESAKVPSMATLNLRTPERIMRSIFGQEKGAEVNAALFDAVSANEAERFRWVNDQFDKVRTFEDSRGRQSELNRQERELTMRLMEGKAAAEAVAGSEMKEAIQNAAAEIHKGGDVSETAEKFKLNGEARKLAEQYAQWLETQEALESPKVDQKKVETAAKTYSELFDQYYDAINDFLVAHGYEPIGYIKGYAPHLQPDNTQDLFHKALQSMGMNPDVTQLPSSIAGRTADYKPNKRWNPFFLSRTGTEAKYDIAEAFESYVEYLSDVLYHTDDIMRTRAMNEYFRRTYAEDTIREKIDQAREIQNSSLDQQMNFLRDQGVIQRDSVLPPEDTRRSMDEYIEKLYEDTDKKSTFSNLVMWLDNYANILAAKQNYIDRGREHGLDRKFLNFGNKLVGVFGRAQVAGNLSSALNQAAQLPQIQAELGIRDTLGAFGDILTGKTNRGGWAQQSDFLTGKKGVDYLLKTPMDTVVSGLFTPAEMMDTLMSTLAVRGKYRQAIRQGMSEQDAMKAADRYGKDVMGSRMKGSKPLAFTAKSTLYQMATVFQVEAVNTWEHVGQDIFNRDIQEIAEQKGKAAAVGEIALRMTGMTVLAFMLNSVANLLYGGSPAPFDLLGWLESSFAAGVGSTSGEVFSTMFDNVVEKFTDERPFGTDGSAINTEDFDVDAAAEDLFYNMSNDVPFLRNVSGLLGWGDETLPMPDLLGTGGDLIDSFKENGLLSNETMLALLGLAGEFAPAGKQVSKIAQGLPSALSGGVYSGYGEDRRLKYPIENAGVSDIANAVDENGLLSDETMEALLGFGRNVKSTLFGNYALEASDAYYNSDANALTVKQTQLYDSLVAQGADKSEVYRAIQDIRDIGNDDSLTSTEKGKQERAVIRQLNLSDNQKLTFYREMLTTTTEEEDEDGEGNAAKFRVMMDSGLSFNRVMDIYDQYKTIKDDEDMNATEKATQFAAWLDQQSSLSEEQRAAAKEQLLYWSQVPASAGKYEKFTAAGLDTNEAVEVTEALSNIGEDPSTVEKYRAIADMPLDETDKGYALSAIMSESAYANYESAMASGLSTEDYVQFLENIQDISGDGKQDRIWAVINNMPITSAQKDALHLAAGYKESTLYKTPWH